MIPPILHQTWKNDTVPARFQAWSESWRRHNPDMRRMFWNDRQLLEFVAAHYPDFLGTFLSYRSGILRADAGRYLLLHHFGGIYADLDCECVASFAELMAEDRLVLCKEPSQHFAGQAVFRGLPYLIFNGTMASPPGHPFWLHLLGYLPALAQAKEVIDATGPAVLTSAYLSFPDKDAISLCPSGLFTPVDREGERDSAAGGKSLSVHHWAGTWWSPYRKRKAVRNFFYRLRYLLTRGEHLADDEARRRVDPAVLDPSVLPGGDNIAVLVPVRDAEEHVVPFLAAMRGQDFPTHKIKLVFCEGDSQDGSWERLQAAVESHRTHFREIVLLRHEVGTEIDRRKRTRPRTQRSRRSGIAKVRNHLIANGLDQSDDWALWIDIDVWKFPKDIICTLLGAGHRIVVPNCVLAPGGHSFDMNSFVTTRPERDHRYYRMVVGGIYQPPIDFPGRLHLSDVRHLEKIDLHGVGGTMLLVDAALHRGGLNFPEKPYKDLIETEAFGLLARDLGVTPVGLPRVEIQHVPW